MSNLIKTLDVDIDYKRLLEEYHNLNIDVLLKKNRNQIAAQSKINSLLETELVESTGSLWRKWVIDDTGNAVPVKKDIEIIKIVEGTVKDNIFNYTNHPFYQSEPVMKYDDNKNAITCYVNIIDKDNFTLNRDRACNKIIEQQDNSYHELYRDISESLYYQTCKLFQNTYIEEVINKINMKIPVVRGRFMMSNSRSCLSWHKDFSTRIHVPIYTNDDCFMVVDNKVIRLPFGETYWVNTKLPHTAVNASEEDRVHLVFCVSEDIEF